MHVMPGMLESEVSKFFPSKNNKVSPWVKGKRKKKCLSLQVRKD